MTFANWLGIMGAAALLVFVWIALFPPGEKKGESAKLSDHMDRAKAWLADNGYHIVRGRQVAQWVGYYDKDEYRKLLSIDFIVRKGADYFAVKVTRDQDQEISGLKLREEWFPLCDAFGVKGILHLDVSSGEPHTIDFEVVPPRYVRIRQLGYKSGWMLTGAIAMFALLHRT